MISSPNMLQSLSSGNGDGGLASNACRVIEAATSQRRGLLLRQYAPRDAGRELVADSQKLAEIRSSSSVHRLSLELARRSEGTPKEDSSW